MDGRTGNVTNDKALVDTVISTLAADNLAVWLFGGWAEELWELIPPRSHNDIDLLYPAANFDLLDTFLLRHGLEEVPAKRFSHKRAIEYEGVLVEFLLVNTTSAANVTSFFDGRLTFRWPANTFSFRRRLLDTDVNVASVSALAAYRQNRGAIHAARRAEGAG